LDCLLSPNGINLKQKLITKSPILKSCRFSFVCLIFAWLVIDFLYSTIGALVLSIAFRHEEKIHFLASIGDVTYLIFGDNNGNISQYLNVFFRLQTLLLFISYFCDSHHWLRCAEKQFRKLSFIQIDSEILKEYRRVRI